MTPLVEIVCCSVDDCVAAVGAGAGRIELCCAIELGGLTPSIGLVRGAVEAVSGPVMAMIRPRSGGFCYSASEFDTMIADCQTIDGPAGFVFGVLNPDGTIDKDRCKQLVRRAGRLEKVFHRAFDLVPDPSEALEVLVDLGFTRILTSGLAATALDGAEMIRRLIERADGRIEIMPGGGVRSGNVGRILETGCGSVHLAPRVLGTDGASVLDAGEVADVVRVCEAGPGGPA